MAEPGPPFPDRLASARLRMTLLLRGLSAAAGRQQEDLLVRIRENGNTVILLEAVLSGSA